MKMHLEVSEHRTKKRLEAVLKRNRRGKKSLNGVKRGLQAITCTLNIVELNFRSTNKLLTQRRTALVLSRCVGARCF